MFIPPGTEVYEGMIVGIHNARENDLNVNVVKAQAAHQRPVRPVPTRSRSSRRPAR